MACNVKKLYQFWEIQISPDKRQGGNHNYKFTFGYDVWGKSTLAELISVVVVRTVVTPKLTLAGTALRSSHKLVNDMNTMNVAGM